MAKEDGSNRRIGPIVVLTLGALLVTSFFAYATANNWLSFITGDVYKEGEAPPVAESLDEPDEAPSSSASPAPATGDYDDGFEQGRKDGYKRGSIVGRKDGYRHGYSVGLNKGIKETRDAGYSAGYAAGERAGVKDGRKELARDYEAWRASK